MKASPPVTITRRGIIIAAGIVGVAMGLALIAVVWIALQVNDVQQAEIHANQRDIAALKRTDARLRRIEQPTQEQLTNAALRALRAIRSCARSPRCRKRNPGVTRLARAIPRGPIPRRAPRRRTSSSSGGGGTTSGGTGTTTAPSPPGRPQGPTQTGSRPQPTRPPAPSRPPANTPAKPPASPPAAQNPPAPTPRPPASVPAVTTPPVGPVPPQTTPNVPLPPVPPLPPLPGVCTPAIGVNCPKAQ